MTNEKKNLCLSDEFVAGDWGILEISFIFRHSSSSGNVLLFFSFWYHAVVAAAAASSTATVLGLRTY